MGKRWELVGGKRGAGSGKGRQCFVHDPVVAGLNSGQGM